MVVFPCPNAVCASVGLSTATSTHWKNGVIPNLKTVSMLAEYFDVSIDYLLGKEEMTVEQFLIDENMLYMYVDKINEEYSNNNTKKSIISQVRHYLKFHKDKYNLKESSLEIISLKGLYEYSGGNPITDNDLKIIYKEVKELAEANKSLRIYAIAFEISFNARDIDGILA